MKRTMQLMMVAVLLLAVTSVKADGYKGTIERHGGKLEYSLSGCVVTKKSKPVIGGMPSQMLTRIEGEVQAGATVTVSGRKLAGWAKFDEVTLDIYGNCPKIKKKGDGSVSTSFTVPANADEVNIDIEYRNRRTWLQASITLKVVKEAKQQTKDKVQQTSVGSRKQYTDQVTHEGHTMKYSITGPTIKLKEDPRLVTNVTTSYYQVIKGITKPGQVIDVNMAKVAGIDTARLNISFEYLRKGATPVFSNTARMIHTQKTDKTSKTYVVPGDAEVVYVHLYYQVPRKGIECDIDITANLYVGNEIPDYALSKDLKPVESTATATTTTPKFNWNDIAEDENCYTCKQPYSHYEVYGAEPSAEEGFVARMCKDREGDHYTDMSPFWPFYYHDYIRTKSESILWLDHGSNERCITLWQNSLARLERLSSGKDRWYLEKGYMIANFGATDDIPSFQLANCVAYPKSAVIMAVEQKGKESRVYLLMGNVEVVSIHGGQKQTLKPSHVMTVTTDGKQSMETFSIGTLWKQVRAKSFSDAYGGD